MKHDKVMAEKSKEKRRVILVAAFGIAMRAWGWNSLTRLSVAQEAKCSSGIVSFHFGTMDGLRREVIKLAVKSGAYSVIGQAIAAGDPYALTLPRQIKALSINTFFAASEE
jgi:DNA-binding transcriptional regulator YbjK